MSRKRIIIVGGTSGIGLSVAAMAREAGADVVAIGRDTSRFDSAESLGCTTTALDAMDIEAVDGFFHGCGVFDHLVLCASGAAGAGPFRTLDLADLRQGFERKFWPQVNCLKAALQSIDPAGSITLVSAISARALQPGTAGLAAINSALEAMVPVLASELRPLRVNAVAPGVIDTPWWQRVPEAQRKELFERMAASVPAGRIGRPDDVAQAILMLIHNTFITGTVIDCDGGWKLKSPGP